MTFEEANNLWYAYTHNSPNSYSTEDWVKFEKDLHYAINIHTRYNLFKNGTNTIRKCRKCLNKDKCLFFKEKDRVDLYCAFYEVNK